VSEIVYAWVLWLYMAAKAGDIIATFLDKFHVMYSDFRSGNFNVLSGRNGQTSMAYVFE
jgi:hypothetical protein